MKLDKEQTLSLESAQSSDQGRKRSNNQDWAAGFDPTDPIEISQSGSLYIVADGVGGASRGERASKFAADKVLFDFFQEPDIPPAIRLQEAMRKACQEIFDYAIDNNLGRMATTMVAANIKDNVLTVANVGDSRCYLIRSGKVVQITQDHNMASELVRNGSITPEAAKYTKRGNTLLRSIGGDPDVEVDIFGEIDLFPGDFILLCSDGLTRYAEDQDLLRLTADGTAEQISQRLVDFANDAGGADNVTAYVIKVGSDNGLAAIDEAKTLPEPITLVSPQQKKLNLRSKLNKPVSNKENRQKIFNIFLLSVLVLVAAVGIFFLTQKDKDQASSLSETPTVVETTTVVSTAESAIGAPPVEISTQTTEITPAIPQETTLAQNIYPIITSMAEPTQPIVGPETDACPVNFCVFEVTAGWTTVNILYEYGIEFNEDSLYHYYMSCSKDNKQCECESREEVVDPADIDIGWFLEIPIPGEVNQEKCESATDKGNSYWMTISP